jgi:hypothetical protein
LSLQPPASPPPARRRCPSCAQASHALPRTCTCVGTCADDGRLDATCCSSEQRVATRNNALPCTVARWRIVHARVSHPPMGECIDDHAQATARTCRRRWMVTETRCARRHASSSARRTALPRCVLCFNEANCAATKFTVVQHGVLYCNMMHSSAACTPPQSGQFVPTARASWPFRPIWVRVHLVVAAARTCPPTRCNNSQLETPRSTPLGRHLVQDCVDYRMRARACASSHVAGEAACEPPPALRRIFGGGTRSCPPDVRAACDGFASDNISGPDQPMGVDEVRARQCAHTHKDARSRTHAHTDARACEHAHRRSRARTHPSTRAQAGCSSNAHAHAHARARAHTHTHRRSRTHSHT